MADADFLVVGGGLYGAAITYELTQAGSSATLLEASRLAARASGGPGKRGVRANLRNSNELVLARESLELWPHLASLLGSETGFEGLGGLMLISSMPDLGEIGLAQAEAHLRLQISHGIRTELLDRANLLDLEPGIGDSEMGALLGPDEGIADQGLTTRAYAFAARSAGAMVRECSAVHSVGTRPHPWVKLEDGTTLSANRAVVLAANFGTNAVLGRSGFPQLPLWTMAPQVIMFRAPDRYQPRHLIGHIQKKLAVKPLASGITMISGGMRGRWNTDEAIGVPVRNMIDESLAVAASVLPCLKGGTMVSADASRPETYTPDGLPYVDFIDDEDRLFVASGWHGHGFAIAPALAKHIAHRVSTGRGSEVLAPFRVRREQRLSTASRTQTPPSRHHTKGPSA